MRSFHSNLLMMLAFTFPCFGQEPEVDQAEVLRLGDVVQHVGGGHRQVDSDAFVAAMSPPASDADKWFISVISMQGCSGCEKLKRDWNSNSALLALADPKDTARSWSHYNVYDRDDRSQMFRFANIKVSAYPTVIVQPPRSGKYGEPGTVVFQSTYGGDPEKLARGIAEAIRRYVSKLPDSVRAPQEQLAGVDPPWQSTPKVTPALSPVQPTPLDPLIPPAPASETTAFPWSALLAMLTAGISLPAAVAIVIGAFYAVRARRQATGKRAIIDPATLDRLLKQLQQLSENNGSTSVTAPKSRRRSAVS